MDFSGSLYDDLLDDTPIVSFAPQAISQAPTAAAPAAQDDDLYDGTEAAQQPQAQAEEEEPESFPIALCKMFVGGLKWETTSETVRAYFEKFGSIEECTVMKDVITGRSRGFGFVTFSHPKTLDRVLKQDHTIDGKIVDPKRAVQQDEDGIIAKIFVGGVPTDVDEAALKEYFSSWGEILDASLMMDRVSGRSRGFGFVTFDDYSAIDALLDAQRREYLRMRGKKIEIKPATPRTKPIGTGIPLEQQQYQQQALLSQMGHPSSRENPAPESESREPRERDGAGRSKTSDPRARDQSDRSPRARHGDERQRDRDSGSRHRRDDRRDERRQDRDRDREYDRRTDRRRDDRRSDRGGMDKSHNGSKRDGSRRDDSRRDGRRDDARRSDNRRDDRSANRRREPDDVLQLN
ncbi:hypothetical protein HDU91_007237 [Kappamyces sp. JEL0680]|nr:hypothetical protein HDU91_007237 [Kappamyces sp. JEL0680]